MGPITSHNKLNAGASQCNLYSLQTVQTLQGRVASGRGPETNNKQKRTYVYAQFQPSQVRISKHNKCVQFQATSPLIW